MGGRRANGEKEPEYLAIAEASTSKGDIHKPHTAYIEHSHSFVLRGCFALEGTRASKQPNKNQIKKTTKQKSNQEDNQTKRRTRTRGLFLLAFGQNTESNGKIGLSVLISLARPRPFTAWPYCPSGMRRESAGPETEVKCPKAD